MIIRLTHAQWATIRRRISSDLEQAMLENRVAIRKMHDYALPAIGWRRVMDQLNAVAYGPLGGKKAETPTLYKAISRICDKVGLMESHPAMTLGRGVLGVSHEIIPAWTDEKDYPAGNRSPYPAPGRRFVYLTPIHLWSGDRAVTIWRVSVAEPEKMAKESALHVALSGGVEV